MEKIGLKIVSLIQDITALGFQITFRQYIAPTTMVIQVSSSDSPMGGHYHASGDNQYQLEKEIITTLNLILDDLNNHRYSGCGQGHERTDYGVAIDDKELEELTLKILEETNE